MKGGWLFVDASGVRSAAAHSEAHVHHVLKTYLLTFMDRHLRGLSGSSPTRSVLIKICANKKIGEERRGDYPEAGTNLEYEGKTNLK